MREILFRGKALHPYTATDSQNGWVYGTPVPIRIDAYMTDRIEIVNCHGYDELDYYELLSEDDEIIPETLGQFTGLLDKNGKKIFEGDIVYNGSGNPGVVEWACGAFIVRFFNGDDWDVGQYIKEEYTKIIGNIHDNPELLEVK
jgi:hypothetical protein